MGEAVPLNAIDRVVCAATPDESTTSALASSATDTGAVNNLNLI